jgi:DENN (AEX-3) domain
METCSLAHREFCFRSGRRRDVGADSDADSLTEADSDFLLTGFDDMTTFESKTICLVSRFPHWTAFRRFLSHLHIISGSTSDLPLERTISHLLLSVPLPRPGGSNVLVPLATLHEPMVLSMPAEKDFPLVDLPFHRLFSVLDVRPSLPALWVVVGLVIFLPFYF